MAGKRGFLSKKEVAQIIKFSWGIGKPSHWNFEYMGKDVIYLSYNKSDVDCILCFKPTKVPGIIFYQLYSIFDGHIKPYLDCQGREKYCIFCYVFDLFKYVGFAHGDLYKSSAYTEALERVDKL